MPVVVVADQQGQVAACDGFLDELGLLDPTGLGAKGREREQQEGKRQQELGRCMSQRASLMKRGRVCGKSIPQNEAGGKWAFEVCSPAVFSVSGLACLDSAPGGAGGLTLPRFDFIGQPAVCRQPGQLLHT